MSSNYNYSLNSKKSRIDDVWTYFDNEIFPADGMGYNFKGHLWTLIFASFVRIALWNSTLQEGSESLTSGFLRNKFLPILASASTGEIEPESSIIDAGGADMDYVKKEDIEDALEKRSLDAMIIKNGNNKFFGFLEWIGHNYIFKNPSFERGFESASFRNFVEMYLLRFYKIEAEITGGITVINRGTTTRVTEGETVLYKYIIRNNYGDETWDKKGTIELEKNKLLEFYNEVNEEISFLRAAVIREFKTRSRKIKKYRINYRDGLYIIKDVETLTIEDIWLIVLKRELGLVDFYDGYNWYQDDEETTYYLENLRMYFKEEMGKYITDSD